MRDQYEDKLKQALAELDTVKFIVDQKDHLVSELRGQLDEIVQARHIEMTYHVSPEPIAPRKEK
mgnify:CR=1 FL=1